MKLDSDADNNDTQHFAVPYALDPDQFFRRQCPTCDREFKVLAEAISIADSLSPAFRRIELEHGILLSTSDEERKESETQQLTCPYCGHTDEHENFNTQEFVEYAVRWMDREVVHGLLSQFGQALGDVFSKNSNGRSSGFLSIEVTYEHQNLPKPIRPVSGPELPDMRRVEVLCCGKILKIADDWGASIYCPYCSQELVLQ